MTYFRRTCAPVASHNPLEQQATQTATMQRIQVLVACYLLAVHDHCKESYGEDVFVGGSAFHSLPAHVTGHECFRVLEWCKAAYRKNDEHWRSFKSPCRLSFLRTFKSLGMNRDQTWSDVFARIPDNLYKESSRIRGQHPELVAQIAAQLKRYRHHKATAPRFTSQNELRQELAKVLPPSKKTK